MPEQRGKRRKRPRKRTSGQGLMPSEDVDSQPSAPAPASRPARPTRRLGPQLPLWGNVLIGVLILGAGLYFSLSTKGQNTELKIVLLILYAGLAGLYFGRAYRQFRRR